MNVRRLGLPLLTTLIAIACPSVAAADIFAATQRAAPSPRTDLDVTLADTSNGLTRALPPAVNTNANELHPSVTPDGSRLVFERVDPAAGTDRILMADLMTGTVSDLFNGFEIASSHPTSPAITPDGKVAITGGFPPSFHIPTLTDLSTFPTGPYSRTSISAQAGGALVNDPVATGSASGSVVAFRVNDPLTVPPVKLGIILSPTSPTFGVSSSGCSFRPGSGFSCNVSWVITGCLVAPSRHSSE